MAINFKKQLIIGTSVFAAASIVGIPVIVATTLKFPNDGNFIINEEVIKNDKVNNNIKPFYNGVISDISNTNLGILNFSINSSPNSKIEYIITNVEPSNETNLVLVFFEGRSLENKNLKPVAFTEEISGFLYTTEQIKNKIIKSKLKPTFKNLETLPSKLKVDDIVNPNPLLFFDASLIKNHNISFSYTLSDADTAVDSFGDSYGRDVIVKVIVTGRDSSIATGSYELKLKNDVSSFINASIFNSNLNRLENAAALLDNSISKNATLATNIKLENFNLSPSFNLAINSNSVKNDITIKQKLNKISNSNNSDGNLFLEIKATADLSSLSVGGEAGPSNYTFIYTQVEEGFLDNNKRIEEANRALNEEIAANGLNSIIPLSNIKITDESDFTQLLVSNWNLQSFTITKPFWIQQFQINGIDDSITYDLKISKIQLDPTPDQNAASLIISATPQPKNNIGSIELGSHKIISNIPSIMEAEQKIALQKLAFEKISPIFKSSDEISSSSLPSIVVNQLNSSNFENHFIFSIPENSYEGTTFTVQSIKSFNDNNGSIDLNVKISILGSAVEENYVAKVSNFSTISNTLLNSIYDLINLNNNSKMPIYIASQIPQSQISVKNVRNNQLTLSQDFIKKLSAISTNLNVFINIGNNATDRDEQKGEIRGNVTINSPDLDNPIVYAFILGGFLSTNAINFEVLQEQFRNLPSITLINEARRNAVLPGLISTQDFNKPELSNEDISITYNEITNPNILNGTLNLSVTLSILNTDGITFSRLTQIIQIINLPTIDNYLNYLAEIIKPKLLINQSDELLLPSIIDNENPVFPGTNDPIFSLSTNNINFINGFFNSIQFKIIEIIPNDLNGSAELKIKLFVDNSNVPSLNRIIESEYTLTLPAKTFGTNLEAINEAVHNLDTIISTEGNDPNDFILYNGSKLTTNSSLVNSSDLTIDFSLINDFANIYNVIFSIKINSINSTDGEIIVNLIGKRFDEKIISSKNITLTGFQNDKISISIAMDALKTSISTATPEAVFNGKLLTGGTGSINETEVSQVNAGSFSFDFNKNGNLSDSGSENPNNLIKYEFLDLKTNSSEGEIVLSVKLSKNGNEIIDKITIQGFKRV